MADSYHASVHTMLEESREAGESTAFDRMDDDGHALQVLRAGHPLLAVLAGPLPAHREVAARRLRHRRRRHGHAQLPAAEHDGHRHLHLPRQRGHEDPGAGQAGRHLRDQGLEQARDARRRRRRGRRAARHAAQARRRRDPRRVQPRPPEPVAVRREDGAGQARRQVEGTRHHAGRRAPREHVRHLELPHQRRRQLREPRPQGPAPRHRHRLRRADPARARPGRAVGHADAAPDQGRPRHHRPRVREHRRQRPRADGRRRADRRRP